MVSPMSRLERARSRLRRSYGDGEVVMSAMTDSRSASDARDDEATGAVTEDDSWGSVMGGLASSLRNCYMLPGRVRRQNSRSTCPRS